MLLRHVMMWIVKGAIGKGTHILSDSQAVIKVLDNCKINLKLVWDCHQSLMVLAECNNVQLLWMLGHKGTEGDENADQLARRGLLYKLIGPKSTCSISDKSC
jgi:ribonuclease HI